MTPLTRARDDLMLAIRGWRARRRLRAELLIDLTRTLQVFETRISQLETDLDELRADSRRVAELRIQVEDFLADRE